MILRSLVLLLLASLLAVPPVAAQGDADPEFDPVNPGQVKRPIEIEDVISSGGGDHWEFRIKGRADYEDGCLVNLVLRYPAIDPSLARGVAWTETQIDKGRFEQTLSFSGQVLFPGLYEAVAVFSGANQPEPFAEKYQEEYREANHIFSLGSEGEVERTEALLAGYYLVVVDLLDRRIREVKARHDALVEWNPEKEQNGSKGAWDKEGTLDETVWRKWLDEDWRPRIDRLYRLLRGRQEHLFAERYPNAANDLEALCRTALGISYAYSRRVYEVHKGAADRRDTEGDSGEGGSAEDRLAYAEALLRSIDHEVGLDAGPRATGRETPEGLAELLAKIEKSLGSGSDSLGPSLAGVSAADFRKPLEFLYRKEAILVHWTVWSASRPESAEGEDVPPEGDVPVDVRYLAVDATGAAVAGWIRFQARPGEGGWRVTSIPEVVGQRVF